MMFMALQLYAAPEYIYHGHFKAACLHGVFAG